VRYAYAVSRLYDVRDVRAADGSARRLAIDGESWILSRRLVVAAARSR
jgi:hypothetical protein